MIRDLAQGYIALTKNFESLSLLAMRLILAYGFYEPALKKLTGFDGIVQWFDQSLHLPFPYLNAVMATATEVLGVILLALGLKTRMIAFPLMVVMVVAIVTVHGANGFAASQNGYEIPLYYMIMLFVLMTQGAGKISLDETLFKNWFSSKS